MSRVSTVDVPRRSRVTQLVTIAAVLVVGLLLLVGPLARWPWAAMVTWALAAALLAWTLHRHHSDRRRYERSLAEAGAREARSEQRLELARTLHERLSSHLGAITMQSSIALRDPATIPPQEALATVEYTSREATHQLRTVIIQLRDGSAGFTVPGAQRITTAVSSARAQGMDVTLQQSTGIPDRMLDLLATVVEEGITNAFRHAGPGKVQVVIDQAEQHATAVIEDSGPVLGCTGVRGTGFGLSGLRELIAPCGGELEAGPMADGSGWRLAVRIPRDTRSGA